MTTVSCHHSDRFRSIKQNPSNGYQTAIDSTIIIREAKRDSIKESKKAIHEKVDGFNGKIRDKNNSIGYGISILGWALLMGGIVLSIWLTVNGII